MVLRLLFAYFYAFREEGNFWYMYHDGIVVDSRFYLIKGEVLRKDDRPRKCSIITLFDEHAFRIKIDRRVVALSGDSEDIARECYVDLTRVDSGDRSYDDDLFCKVEHIDRDLSDIDLTIMSLMDIDFDRLVSFMTMTRIMRF